MRYSEPGASVAVAIVASRAPGRWAWVVRPRNRMENPRTINRFLVTLVGALLVAVGAASVANFWPRTTRLVGDLTPQDLNAITNLVCKDQTEWVYELHKRYDVVAATTANSAGQRYNYELKRTRDGWKVQWKY
jgi:hypothetical protein